MINGVTFQMQKQRPPFPEVNFGVIVPRGGVSEVSLGVIVPRGDIFKIINESNIRDTPRVFSSLPISPKTVSNF